MAKREFEKRGWEYTAYSINEGPLSKNNKASLMERFPNAKTVPQIWINDNHIGGYTELKKWLNTYLDV
jgi:glutaredoxin